MAPFSVSAPLSYPRSFFNQWLGLFRRQNIVNNDGDDDDDDDDNNRNGLNKNNGNGQNRSSGADKANDGAGNSRNNNQNNQNDNSKNSQNNTSSSGQGNNSGNANNNNGNSNNSNNNNGNSNNSNGSSSGQTKDSNNSGSSTGNNTQNRPICLSCFIPDNDPRVIYQGPWSLVLSSFFTTHQTTTQGASVKLQFNGTSITVFGTIAQSNATFTPPTTSYIIDAEPPFVTTQPMASQNFDAQRLFSARDLSPNEEHTITIQVVDAGAPYIFQSFFIPPPEPSNSSTINETVPSALSVTSSQVAAPTGTAEETSPSTTVITTPALEPSSASNTVKILAATLGCVVAIVLALVAFFLWRRRRQTNTRRSDRRSSKASLTYTEYTSSSAIRASQFTSSESILRSIPSTLYNPYTGPDLRRGSVVDYYLSFPGNGRHSLVPPVPPKP